MKDFGAKTVVFPPKLYIIVAGWHTVFRYQLLMHIIWSIFDQNNAYRTQGLIFDFSRGRIIDQGPSGGEKYWVSMHYKALNVQLLY